jgi:2-phospho-L-lactate/phosphoenolpyruvate guanylyltransferase
VQTAVIVPVKNFAHAKGRLASVLDPSQRAELAARMAAIVVRAAAPLPVVVVCDDEEVVEWAARHGARALHLPGLGLNPAVGSAINTLAAEGTTRVVVAHSDLPLATSLFSVVGGRGVTLVPDRHGDGTNVMVVPTGAGFVPAYGAGSFRRHLTEARRVGLPVRVVRDRKLSWDVDVPADLSIVESWTFPDSRR